MLQIYGTPPKPQILGLAGLGLAYDVACLGASRALEVLRCRHVFMCFPFMIESCICNRQGSLDKRKNASIHK